MYIPQQQAEIKKQIFHRYIGSEILGENDIEPSKLIGIDVRREVYYSKNLPSIIPVPILEGTLSLHSLESITDEDAILISILRGLSVENNRREFMLKSGREVLFCDYKNRIEQLPYYLFQYLQLKSYALPQLLILEGNPITLSVQELLDMNIIKLK